MARRKKRSSEEREEKIKENISEEQSSDFVAELVDFVKSELDKVITYVEPACVSTGIKPLDAILGGGFYTSLLTGITSPAETGKSTIAVQMAVKLLKQNPNSLVMYIDTETPPIKDYQLFRITQYSRLRNFGATENEIRRFIYAPGLKKLSTIFEEIVKFVNKKQEVEKKRNVEPIPMFIIFDSITEAIPDVLLEDLKKGKLEKLRPGLVAQEKQEFLSKIQYACEQNNIGLILLDQVRMDIQINPYQKSDNTVKHNSYKTASSFKALEHKTRQWIFLEKGKNLTGEYPDVVGWMLTVHIDKSKTIPSTGMNVEVVFDKRYGLNEFWSHFHFLSNRMPFEDRFLKNASIPSQTRRHYEENASLAIQNNKIFFPGITSEPISYRSKLDVYRKYNEDEKFKKLFDKIVEESVNRRINYFIESGFEFSNINDKEENGENNSG